MFRLYHIFTTCTGLELPTDLSKKFAKEPEDWKSYYVTKNASIHQADNEILLIQSNKEYEEAKKYLNSFQDDMNYSNLVQIASKMLWILGIIIVYVRVCVLSIYLFKT